MDSLEGQRQKNSVQDCKTNKALKKIIIYTDGACSGNPGKGGWGAILICKTKDKNGKEVDFTKKISGGDNNTTNNKMELTAVIEALKILKTSCEIDLFTDSKYVMDGATKWLKQWQDNNWRCANKKPVKNQELWQELSLQSQKHIINWHWVKGHADNVLNNEVDRLARAFTA